MRCWPAMSSWSRPSARRPRNAFEGVGELEVGLGVVQLGVEAVELGLQRGLALAQRGHPGAELVERDELFLVGLDQPLDRGAGAGEVALERFAAAGGGVLGPRRGEAAVDLGADELGVSRAVGGPRPRRAGRARRRGPGGWCTACRRGAASRPGRCSGSS